MANLIDMVGRRFGRWVVIAYAGGRKWSCICDCGTPGVVCGANLRRGTTRSCGRCRDPKHGMRWSREYNSWRSMKARCLNPNDPFFENYGGRGISICEGWHSSFEAFFADLGPRPEGCSLDRIDPNGNYEASNCRWADAKQQRHNRRRANTL